MPSPSHLHRRFKLRDLDILMAVAEALVSPIIDRVSRSYPRMTFSVLIGETPRLLEELDARNVDLIIHRWSQVPDERYFAEVLFHDQPALATGIKHPLARRHSV